MITITYAYNRFCTKRFPLPSETQVAELEARIGVTFPDEFRRYVLQFNGGYFNDPEIVRPSDGTPEDLLAFISGIGASHEEAELGHPSDLVIFDDNNPPKILPIGATPMGSLIISLA